jgi:hypothetical protein
MTLTWVFAICLLNSQGQCHAYIPQTNFAYLSLEDAKQRCLGLLSQDPGNPQRGTKNVCIKALQFDVSYGAGK